MRCLHFRCVPRVYIRESQAGVIAITADGAICDSLVVKVLVQNAGNLYVRVAVLHGCTGSVYIDFVTVALSGIPALRQGATWSEFWSSRHSGIVAKRN